METFRMSIQKFRSISAFYMPLMSKIHPNIPTRQAKAANAIVKCKTGELGYTKSYCESCGNILDLTTVPAEIVTVQTARQ